MITQQQLFAFKVAETKAASRVAKVEAGLQARLMTLVDRAKAGEETQPGPYTVKTATAKTTIVDWAAIEATIATLGGDLVAIRKAHTTNGERPDYRVMNTPKVKLG